MIAYAEGTGAIGKNKGYDVLCGGGLFVGYDKHPAVRTLIKKLGIYSTAAGRYQILLRYFNAYQKTLNLPDFSPDSQDKIAIQMIAECRALHDIDNGRINSAIKKCRSRWASFPGAGYGQNEIGEKKLIAAYKEAGGTVSTKLKNRKDDLKSAVNIA